ncbi:MAG: aromatic ring-hydroxylating dioxygenase subunit alpha [Sphingobacteriales bacterium]|nr:aromatic ring-hydroxylating dioxygenase subunit alpha [Sphingobacteriales bacterium]
MIVNQWYLACLLEELEQQNPLRKKICGEEIVIFRTESGKVSVVEDRCCHRNVQLSLGYVQGENIKCGYHGWEYNCEGKCVRIPSLPDEERIPPAARVKRYSTEIRYRSVWVWIGDDNKKDLSLIPPMPEMEVYPMVYNYHVINADLQLVAESLFDAHHINHVHRDSIKGMMGALRSERIDFNLQVNDNSIVGMYHRENDRSFFEKYYFGFNQKVETHFGFWFPNISKLDIRFRNRHMVIYEHFYQIDEDNVMMCQITLWKNILGFLPLYIAKKFMLRKSVNIVREDIEFLENNKRIKAVTGKSDLLIKSDEVTFEFMKLWKRKTNS